MFVEEMFGKAGGVLLCEAMIGMAKFVKAGAVLLCLVRLGVFMQSRLRFCDVI